MEKKKLLYIMGVDWNWIYQRPHILAEKLTQDFQVTVVFPKSIIKIREAIRNPNVADLNLRVLWTIPFQEKNSFLGKISRFINRKVFTGVQEYEYIYIGYPQYIRYIPEGYTGKIIYDCLDNFEKLYPDQKRSYKVVEHENLLIQKCDILLATSRFLKDKTDAVAGYDKAIILRNATKMMECSFIKTPLKKETYKIGYIGTISRWMDYELLKTGLAQCRNISYHMIGPVEEKCEHEGIIYEGIIAHELLAESIKDYDCLIMPFCVNEITLAVDPVKLYEYIAFGKCIISVYYPEVEQFEDFVYFYHSQEEYVQLIRHLSKEGFPAKYTAEQQKEFLQKNTWDSRYTSLKEIIANAAGVKHGG